MFPVSGPKLRFLADVDQPPLGVKYSVRGAGMFREKTRERARIMAFGGRCFHIFVVSRFGQLFNGYWMSQFGSPGNDERWARTSPAAHCFYDCKQVSENGRRLFSRRAGKNTYLDLLKARGRDGGTSRFQSGSGSRNRPSESDRSQRSDGFNFNRPLRSA